MARFATLAEKMDAYSIPEPNSGCLLWMCAVDTRGYGHSYWEGRDVHVHRDTWIEANGPIPDGLHVLHKCDVRSCRNLAHLKLGTHAENMADKRIRGRQPRGLKAYGGKLSDDDIRAIRADRRVGRLIAAEYGIVHSLVYDIRNRKKRQHVPDLPLKLPLFVGVPTPATPEALRRAA